MSTTKKIAAKIGPVDWGKNYLINSSPHNDITSRHFLTRSGPTWAHDAANTQWKIICDEVRTRATNHNLATSGHPIPLVIIEGRRGSGRGDVVEALIRDSDCVEELLSKFRPDKQKHLVWTFVGSTHFSSEFMSTADAITKVLERALNNEHATVENPRLDESLTWHSRLPKLLQ